MFHEWSSQIDACREINLCKSGLVDCIRQLFQGLGHFVVSIVPSVITCPTYAPLVGINIL